MISYELTNHSQKPIPEEPPGSFIAPHSGEPENIIQIPSPEQLEQCFQEILKIIGLDFVTLINESLIIRARMPNPKISKTNLKKAARLLHNRLQVWCSQPEDILLQNPNAFWRDFNEIVETVVLASGLNFSKRDRVSILEVVRRNEKVLSKIRKYGAITKKEWEAILTGVIAPYHLSWNTIGTNSIEDYIGHWKAKRIVGTLQIASRVWKSMQRKLPKNPVEKLSRLKRTYADASIVFEHILTYNLQLLSALPGFPIKPPPKTATLGRLVYDAKQISFLSSLLSEIDVGLRNAIQHGNSKIALPPRIIWPEAQGNMEESVRIFEKRVKRLVAIDLLLLMGPQTAGLMLLEGAHKKLLATTND
ncbi:MAG: hypothetical protein MPW14_25295 (plasmid) [Candidatus Manganitrophus sp.]|nr:hypothetical protein [Candidatus Manganitrophus sp.]MDC4228121.1 hypothetical protein [Candidatus Manganitrophus sp.]WDT73631.1 MAG: hypothetical protein MPW17_22085 [Candidatus Manganitrophus sp.]WDT77856.1 MAG: hypothetical protein MPW16_21760 [Candidatus Manganitrophus sp.]WDT82706.1 MAG: hypothetical protein MPW14_25295 [Candidatus Manganitrophus sp.]